MLNYIKVFLVLVLLVLAAGSVHAQDKYYYAQGMYAGSETGDYNYLLLNENGQVRSFFCSFMITQYLDALPPTQPIQVKYLKDTQFIPEAGANIEMEIIEEVFVPDEYAPSTGVLFVDFVVP